MAKFKNVSPLGALDIDLLGLREVQPGEVFDVPDDVAHMFIGQAGTFEPVEVHPETVAGWALYLAADNPVAPVEQAPEPPADPAPASKKKEAGE